MLTFGIIGTSWITDSFIESSQATGKWKLVAVCSRTEDKARGFASKYGVTKTFTTLKSMVEESALDAVYIASPNSLHFEQAKLVLQAGKHAIVEKPITSNIKELDALYGIAASAPNGAQLIEAYRHIQEKNFKILKNSIPNVGKLYGANFVFASFSSRMTAVMNGETPPIFSLDYSGGCLVDMGVYPVCFALALFGKPQSQTYRPIMLPTGTDAGGPITLLYDDFTVTLYTSKCYSSTAISEVFGEKGTIAINGVTDIDSIELRTVADKKTTQLAEAKAKFNLMEEAEEFHRLIVEKDVAGLQALAQLSRDVVAVTEDLRRSNNIIYPADK